MEDKLAQARRAVSRGDLALGAATCGAILARSPGHSGAAHLLALIRAHQGRLAESERALRSLARTQPRRPDLLTDLATVLHANGKPVDALEAANRAIGLHSDATAAHLVRARALAALGRNDESLVAYTRVLALAPDTAKSWLEKSRVLFALSRHAEALACAQRALALQPGSAETINEAGRALGALGRHREALDLFEEALRVAPGLVSAAVNQVNALCELDDLEGALAASDRARELAPGNAEAWLSSGMVLLRLARHTDALRAFDQALALDAKLAPALINRGVAFGALGDPRQAIATFDKVLELAPEESSVRYNRGVALATLERHSEAVHDLQFAYDQSPGPARRAALLSTRSHLCDWRNYDELRQEVLYDVEQDRLSAQPFAFLALSDCPRLQRRCAAAWIQRHYHIREPMWRGVRYEHRRIRVAYVSSDFREHAMMHLMGRLFERHDRGRFEMFGVSLSRDDGSDERARAQAAFEHFVDASGADAFQVATLLRKLEIDIAVDLNGFTRGERLAAFAHRPAPIQASYLGYPGTTAADYMDYVIADSTVIPPHTTSHFSERVAYLPDCYQATDDSQAREFPKTSRKDHGLPPDATVLCCFNSVHKITPAAFDSWAHIMREVATTVLWLRSENEVAQRNLRREMVRREIDPGRLVFAMNTPHRDHLARHAVADLFLDTLPYNAHTTATDALWTGLPLLTLQGNSFAGRVASSLLRASGMTELITTSEEEYRARAVELACNGDALRAMRSDLLSARDRSPLFDVDRFRTSLERAYTEMHERHVRGLAPASFAVHHDGV